MNKLQLLYERELQVNEYKYAGSVGWQKKIVKRLWANLPRYLLMPMGGHQLEEAVRANLIGTLILLTQAKIECLMRLS